MIWTLIILLRKLSHSFRFGFLFINDEFFIHEGILLFLLFSDFCDLSTTMTVKACRLYLTYSQNRRLMMIKLRKYFVVR